jgi:hypothetical protein
VLPAARKRGVGDRMITTILGVSYQRVQQRIRRMEKQHGERLPVRAKPDSRRRGGRVPVICGDCGNVRWVLPSYTTRPAEPRKYCSHGCFDLAKRILTDDNIKGAIELRREGRMWREIAFALGTWQQTVQTWISVYLWQRDQPTVPLLSESSAPVPGVVVRPAWRWLVNRSGMELRP